MNIQNKTLKDLKDLCKKNNFKNYSNLNKINLIKFIKKNMEGGNFNDCILNREFLLRLLKIDEEELLLRDKIVLPYTFFNRDITINKIDLDTFNGLNNLKVLNLRFFGNTGKIIFKKGVFSGLSNLEELYISGEHDWVNNPIIIEPGALNGLISLKEIWFTTCVFDPRIFDGLNSLKKLMLDFPYNTTLKSGIFSNLSSLESLAIVTSKKTKDNYFPCTIIEPGAFNGLSSLEKLNLYGINIKTIEPNTFNELSSLKNLKLTSNKMTKIKSGIFIGLCNLKKLDLSNNNIEEIEVGAFDGLSSLEVFECNELHYNSYLLNIKYGNGNPTIPYNYKLIKIKPTAENIRLYNKYFYLWQKIKKIEEDHTIIPKPNGNNKTFETFFMILRNIYGEESVYRKKMYETEKNINIKNAFENKKIINKNITPSNFYINISPPNKNKRMIELLIKNKSENLNNAFLKKYSILDENVKKYLIKKSSLINEQYNSENIKNIKLFYIDCNDILLLTKYVKDGNLNNFEIIDLLKLLVAVDYLGIYDKELMSKLLLNICEIINNYDENKLISIFGLKKINNPNYLSENNNNLNYLIGNSKNPNYLSENNNNNSNYFIGNSKIQII